MNRDPNLDATLILGANIVCVISVMLQVNATLILGANRVCVISVMLQVNDKENDVVTNKQIGSDDDSSTVHHLGCLAEIIRKQKDCSDQIACW